jgi:hypothetical protein
MRRICCFALLTGIDTMDARVVASSWPFSSTFVGFSSFDTAAAWNFAIAFLPSHGTLGACLAFLRHRASLDPGLHRTLAESGTERRSGNIEVRDLAYRAKTSDDILNPIGRRGIGLLMVAATQTQPQTSLQPLEAAIHNLK